MTTRERSSQPDRPRGERSLDVLLDSLLEAGPLPDGEPARWQPVAEVLAALTSAPERHELTGEAQALAEFRARARQAERPAPPAGRAPRWVTSLRGARPAVAAATGAVLAGGLLALAYAGDLPAPAQRLAHDTIHAPAARHPGVTDPDPASSQPAGPLRTEAGHASSPPARRVSVRPGGGPHESSSAPGTAGGSQSGYSGHDHSGQSGPGHSGSPTGSPTPGSTQQPSPSASTAPSAGAAPSPSATPSATGQHHQLGPAGTQSTPP